MSDLGQRGSSSKEPSTGRQLLVCRVGALSCALPLESVSETMRRLPTEYLAGMPPFLDGVARIRGAPVPIVNLAKLLGTELSVDRHQLVLLKLEERNVAFSVDRVIGVRTLDAAMAQAVLPPLLRSASLEYVRAIDATDSRLLLLLEQSQILPESTWRELGLEGT